MMVLVLVGHSLGGSSASVPTENRGPGSKTSPSLLVMGWWMRIGDNSNAFLKGGWVTSDSVSKPVEDGL